MVGGLPAPLFGRDAEVAELAALLDAARAGHGRVALLLGEAGIGKSRLANEVTALAASAGTRVAWGRCGDGDAPPYWPWLQALRDLLGPEAPALFGEQVVRAELLASVTERLMAVAEPAVVVLEDLHWADESSLALLEFAVGAVPGTRLLVLLTARDDTEAATALAGLPPSVVRVSLVGLDPAATAALAEDVAGRAVAEPWAAEIHRRTGGNPFFVTEVARLQAARGEATGEGPAGVRHCPTRRLARLPLPPGVVLGAAAVAGDGSDVDLLAAVAERSADTVLGLLDEAVQSRLGEWVDGRFVFAHALVAETVYQEVAPSRRAAWHRLAAVTTEGRDADPERVAEHWRRAGDRERAASWALRAGRAAMRRLGYEQAVRHLRRALDGAGADRVGILVELGEAQVLAGELGEGRDTLREAAESALREGRGTELARAALGLGTGVGGFEVDIWDRRQRQLLDEALVLLPAGDHPLRAAVMARRSLALVADASPADRADLARDAAAMAARLGVPDVEASALGALNDALAGPDHVAERLATADTMLGLAGAARDARLELLARRHRLVALLESGDLAGVDAEILAYGTVAERLQLPLVSWPVPIWRGMRALMEGDTDTARTQADLAEDLGVTRAGSANATMLVLTLRMAIALATGTEATFVPELDVLIPELDHFPGLGAVLATVLHGAGQAQRGRPYLARSVAAGIDAIRRDSEWAELVFFLGRAGMLYDDPVAVRMAYDALTPYPDLWVVDGIGGACYGVVGEQLERLAAYLGDRDPARTAPRARAAEGEFRRDGRVWHLAWRGTRVTVPHSKGMSDLAALVARPGTEIHVLDLVVAQEGAVVVADGTGPAIDATARAAYRGRIADLDDDITEATDNADLETAAKLRAERDFLLAELAHSLGLGDRARTSGESAERARKAVTMRIGTALRAIEASDPALAQHLRRSVTTGRFCAYRPEDPAVWHAVP